MRFKHDVVIDLVGYRRYGHNELDQPAFTQPLMYKRIKATKPVLQKYEEQLMKEGVLTPEMAHDMKAHIKTRIEKAYERSKTHKFNVEDWKNEEWEEIKKDNPKYGALKDTGVSLSVLNRIGEQITTLPDDWHFHPMVKKIYDTRRKAVLEGKSIDWATAEALAFGTLIQEGFHVRMSG